jgi:hypothetical protein
MDLRRERYPTLEALRRYTYRVASAVGVWRSPRCRFRSSSRSRSRHACTAASTGRSAVPRCVPLNVAHNNYRSGVNVQSTAEHHRFASSASDGDMPEELHHDRTFSPCYEGAFPQLPDGPRGLPVGQIYQHA